MPLGTVILSKSQKITSGLAQQIKKGLKKLALERNSFTHAGLVLLGRLVSCAQTTMTQYASSENHLCQRNWITTYNNSCTAFFPACAHKHVVVVDVSVCICVCLCSPHAVTWNGSDRLPHFPTQPYDCFTSTSDRGSRATAVCRWYSARVTKQHSTIHMRAPADTHAPPPAHQTKSQSATVGKTLSSCYTCVWVAVVSK